MIGHLCKSDQLRIQSCRVFLRVMTLADVSNAKGTAIITTALSGINHRASTLNWPTQQRPPNTSWATWRKFLRSFTRHNKGKDLTLQQQYKMGIWTKTHQTWTWLGNTSRVLNTTTQQNFKVTSYSRRHQKLIRVTTTSSDPLFPADIDNELKVYYTQQTISPTTPQTNQPQNTTYERIGNLTKQYKRIAGTFRPTTKPLQLANEKDGYICVSDGSVCKNISSAAYVIHGKNTRTG